MNAAESYQQAHSNIEAEKQEQRRNAIQAVGQTKKGELEAADSYKKWTAMFSNSQSIPGYIGINDEEKQWAVMSRNSSLTSGKPYDFEGVYKYSDLINYEVVENGNSVQKGNAGYAALGYLAFGIAGAVIGSSASRENKEIVSDLHINVTVNDIKAPGKIIKIINNPVDKTENSYKEAMTLCERIVAVLRYIMNYNESKEELFSKEIPVMNYTLAEMPRVCSATIVYNRDLRSTEFGVSLAFLDAETVEAIKVDTEFISLWGDVLSTKSITFSHFEKNSDAISTDLHAIDLNLETFQEIACVRCILKAMLVNGKIEFVQAEYVNVEDSPKRMMELKQKRVYAVSEHVDAEDSWTCICGRVHPNSEKICSFCGESRNIRVKSVAEYATEWYQKLNDYKNVRAFYDANQNELSTLHNINEYHDLIESILQQRETEKFYGNMKKSLQIKLTQDFGATEC